MTSRLGRVYRITCYETDQNYIGSTIQSLKKRLQGHESAYRLGHHQSSAKVIEGGAYGIQLLENVLCETDLKYNNKREQHHMNKTGCVNFRKSYLSFHFFGNYMKKYHLYIK